MSERPATTHLEYTVGGEQRFISLAPNLVCRFGRGSDNTVIVSDQLVSRNHALIDCRGSGEFYITDLGSRNGTQLNGARVIVPARLSEGDRIMVGEQTFIFRDAVQVVPKTEVPEGAGETVVMVSVEVITVLVTDIRDYTNWSRTLGESRLTSVISAMIQQADVVLRRNEVWGQKYIGDAVMGIWKHHRTESNDRVLRSVLKSTAELFQIVAGLQEQFGFDEPMQIGAGINTGAASVGNMGGDGTSDYTALGDAVNKAFRFESATRVVPCDILIGDATWEWLPPELRSPSFVRRTVPLKGYPDPQPAYEISVSDLQQLLSSTE